MKSQVKGRIQVIAGPMGCGKTTELIRLLSREDVANRRYLVIKPAIDTRPSHPRIVSRTGLSMDAISVELAVDILNRELGFFPTIAIDEAQFFDKGIIPVVNALVEMGKQVIIAGLASDFRREPFGQMGVLLTMADEITLLDAICMVCGAKATLTQRIVNGNPASSTDPIILIGGEESYQARCRNHHVYKSG